MLEQALNDAQEGKIESAFLIGVMSDGDMATYAMGQYASDMVWKMELAKLHMITDAVTYEETGE